MIPLTVGQTFIMPWKEGEEIVDLTCLCLTLLRFLTPLPARERDLRFIPDRDGEEQGQKGSKSRLKRAGSRINNQARRRAR